MATPPQDIALELEKLRTEVAKGFATVQGQLNVLTERTERTDGDNKALELRVSALEKRVWGAAGGAALVGMLVPYLVQVSGG